MPKTILFNLKKYAGLKNIDIVIVIISLCNIEGARKEVNPEILPDLPGEVPFYLKRGVGVPIQSSEGGSLPVDHEVSGQFFAKKRISTKISQIIFYLIPKLLGARGTLPPV